ncbi:30S ribosomal protein S1 [Herpetosiphon llansteffanensis]
MDEQTKPGMDQSDVLPSTGLDATPEADQFSDDDRALLEAYLRDPAHDYRNLKYGDSVDGTIVRVDRDEVLVDIGSKSEGVVPGREMTSLSSEERAELKVGDVLLVTVVQTEDAEGRIVLSIDKARQEKSWRALQVNHEAGDVIHAAVTNYNKGGLLVNLTGVRGFVPSSQVSSVSRGSDVQKQSDMAKLVGQTLPLKIIEINRSRNRLILSERQAVQEVRDSRKDQLLEKLEPGAVRSGRVTSLCDFGAFVDIGGADGLVHLSELSWSRVKHPEEVLKVGDAVNVYILSVDEDKKRIALSIKRTQAEPWTTVTDRYQIGQAVSGVVTQLTAFGAFVRLEDGIEGLIHISEMSDERIQHPRDVINEGDTVSARIIRIDPSRKRIGLSMRNGSSEAADTAEATDVAEATAVTEAAEPATAESSANTESTESDASEA